MAGNWHTSSYVLVLPLTLVLSETLAFPLQPAGTGLVLYQVQQLPAQEDAREQSYKICFFIFTMIIIPCTIYISRPNKSNKSKKLWLSGKT